MRAWKIATISVLATLMAIGGGFLVFNWLAGRDFDQHGSQELSALLNSSMANVFVRPAQTQINEKQSPQVLATYVNALRVGIAAARTSRATALPQTSDIIQSLEPHDKIDAWGHPFCLVALGTRVAVISAGPQEPFPNCRNVGVSDRDILRASPLMIHQFPSGALLLVVDSNSVKP